MASKIPNASTLFEYFANKSDFVMETKALSMIELKDALNSLKNNKNPGFNDISYNVFKKCFDSLREPLKCLKGAAVTQKNDKPISLFQCFSKILKCIIYNHLYKYLIENNILYSKQFSFQNGHSTDHAVVELIDQITESFENNK